jgi:hypothetical protein
VNSHSRFYYALGLGCFIQANGLYVVSVSGWLGFYVLATALSVTGYLRDQRP